MVIFHSYVSYLRTINHSYWSYLHQLSYLTGAPHCRDDVSTVSQEKYALEAWQKSARGRVFSPPVGPYLGDQASRDIQPTGWVETRFFNGMGISNGEFNGISGVSWDFMVIIRDLTIY